MKKLSKETGFVLSKISLIMMFLGGIFLGLLFTKWGWWLDISVLGPLGNILHIPSDFSIVILKCYWFIAILLAVLAGYFSEK